MAHLEQEERVVFHVFKAKKRVNKYTKKAEKMRLKLEKEMAKKLKKEGKASQPIAQEPPKEPELVPQCDPQPDPSESLKQDPVQVEAKPIQQGFKVVKQSQETLEKLQRFKLLAPQTRAIYSS